MAMLKRKKDEYINYLNKKIKKDVTIFFRRAVPAGHSMFHIPVPVSFQDREFYFSKCVLVPDFYSNEAQKLDLDTDIELDEIIDYEMILKIAFDNIRDLYPGEYKPTIPNTDLTAALLPDINNYYQTNKPIGTQNLGFFMDWMDIRFYTTKNISFDQFMQLAAPAYYGEAYDPAKHYNALPISARNVPNVNNYLFPTQITNDLAKHLRFRMQIGPNLKIAWSNDKALLKFGYTLSQIGEKKAKQFQFPNKSNYRYLTLEAEDQPLLDDPIPTDFSTHLYLSKKSLMTEPFEMNIKKGDTFSNPNFKDSIKITLAEIAESCNLVLDFSYNVANKTFEFVFPENLALKNLNLIIAPELAQRLGFKMFDPITTTNKLGKPVNDEPDIAHTEQKCKALCYDTSLVVVSDENSSSNTTEGINEKIMAALYPTDSGTMELPQIDVCQDQPTMKLPFSITTSKGYVNATFKLNRFLDNNKLEKFIWKNGAYICGTLIGKYSDFNGNGN